MSGFGTLVAVIAVIVPIVPWIYDALNGYLALITTAFALTWLISLVRHPQLEM
jgi:hypothetical protein